ncbi:MAG: tail fiber domain-containing protein [Bacteroidetes bacterium]|nr:tail fiber domain-containing protein [Bacteroidota bacterium]
MRHYTLLLTLVLFSALLNPALPQEILITDDDAYTADSSAMLDVYSLSKGVLVPRLTSAQRSTIASPADGLLVFDTDDGSFYFYSNGSWISLTYGNANSLWGRSGNRVFLNDTTWHLGIGTVNPVGKMEVKADGDTGTEEPIFGVINFNGDTVFAVYPQGVRIYVEDDETKAGGNRAGFAVGGFSLSKGTVTNDYLCVTPDSVRIYIEEGSDSKAGPNKGGFAVGGFSLSKGFTNEYFRVTDDSTRVYVEDSTAGFEIANIQTGAIQNFLDLNKINYCIGHESGSSITTGFYNSFLGYMAGKSDTSGTGNVFIGYQSGFSNTSANANVFIGYKSGHFNTVGFRNTFIGYQSGYNNKNGYENTYIGAESGLLGFDTNPRFNAFFGYASGYSNTGYSNSYFGHSAGYNNTGGRENVIIGYMAGFGGIAADFDYNTFTGAYAGFSITTGAYNTFYGYESGYNDQTGGANVFIGSRAGYSNISGGNNVCIGYSAGYSNGSGSYNVVIGDSAGLTGTSYMRNVFIGYQAGMYEDESDRLYIENSPGDSSEALIYGEFDNEVLTFGAMVGMGRYPTANRLEVEGDASKTTAGAWLANSDKRIKTDIREIESPLETVMKLRPVKFKYTTEWKSLHPSVKDHYYFNYIAQEYREVFPESVKGSGEYLSPGEPELLQIDTYNSQVVSVKAVQELIKINREQEKKIAELEDKLNQIDTLENENRKLKAKIENIRTILQASTKNY